MVICGVWWLLMAQILGNNEAFEPFTTNLYTRRVLAGEFVVLNKYMVQDLMKCGLWTSDIRNAIVAARGSLQAITVIPEDIRELYKTVWELRMRTLIDMARDRGAFICQSQSLNLFMEGRKVVRCRVVRLLGGKRAHDVQWCTCTCACAWW